MKFRSLLRKLTVALMIAGLLLSSLPAAADEAGTLEIISPGPNIIRDIWFASATQAYAVGEDGLILSYDGSRWTKAASGGSDTPSLNGIWGTGSNDIYAVGSRGTILHYDGTSWSAMTSGSTDSLNSVWGTGSNDIYAVGSRGTILHYDGTSWSAMTSGSTDLLNGVWGSGSNDIYAVGWKGAVLHYDGSAWTSIDSGCSIVLNDVWGTGTDDVFICGQAGTIMHYDGSSWSSMDSGHNTMRDYFFGFWGTSSTNVYAVGGNASGGIVVHYDGSTWETLDTGISLFILCICSGGENDIHFGLTEGIYHYDGTDCRQTWGSISLADLYDIHGLADDEFFISGIDGEVITWDGTEWKKMNTGLSTSLTNIWAVSPIDIYTGSNGDNLLHYDGVAWSSVDIGSSNSIGDIWGTSAGDVYVALTDGIYRFDGTSWALMTGSPANQNSIWGTSPDDIFTADTSYYNGYVGHLYHYDGSAWTLVREPAKKIFDIWGSSSNNVFAAGYKFLLHYDGVDWAEMTLPRDIIFRGIHGTSFKDVFAFGHDAGVPVFLHYNGSEWAELDVGDFDCDWDELDAVWCDGAGNAWFVGDGGYILKYSYTMPQTYPDWDVNEDGVINFKDLSILREHWGESGEDGWIRADINADGRVNFLDLSILREHYGE